MLSCGYGNPADDLNQLPRHMDCRVKPGNGEGRKKKGKRNADKRVL
jgi:hypothetical protein